MTKKEKCNHTHTHIEYVLGSHHKYEIKVCNKCGKVVKTKIIK